MKVEVTSKNYRVSDRLQSLIEKKVGKVEKFFDKPVKVKVVCTRHDKREKMEVNLTSGSVFIRSEVESDNMYANLDVCMAKIEKQIIKYFGKELAGRNKKALPEFEFYDELPVIELPKITKRKNFELIPMSEKEALMQMDMVGNDFFIFLNADSKRICVLYKRADGDYGIIETK